jgi:Na+-driven multidrug efflux pump
MRRYIGSTFNRYVPSTWLRWKTFLGIALFGMLNIIILQLNGVVDNFMVGNIYQVGDTITVQGEYNIVLDSEQLSEQANSANTKALQYVSLWWFLASVIGAIFSSAMGFFSSMFYGRQDMDKYRNSFVSRTQITIIIVAIFAIIMWTIPEWSINFFANRDISYLTSHKEIGSSVSNISTEHKLNIITNIFEIEVAVRYLKIIVFSWFIWAIVFNLSTSLREMGKTIYPTISALISLLVNIGLNIFFVKELKLGVEGTAYATIVSRFVGTISLAIIIFFTHEEIIPRWRDFIYGYKTSYSLWITKWPYLVFGVLWGISIIARPLFFNYYFQGDPTKEIAGSADTFGIVAPIQNLFMVSYDGVVPIIFRFVGQELGKGNKEAAKTNAYHALGFSFIISCILSVLLIIVGSFTPYYTGIFDVPAYKLEEARLALIIVAFVYPTWSFMGSIRLIMSQGTQVLKASFLDIITTALQAMFALLIGVLHKSLGWFERFFLAYLVFALSDYLKFFIFKSFFNRTVWWNVDINEHK